MTAPAKPSKKSPRDLTDVEHFQAFLNAADAVALEMLVTEGLLTNACQQDSYLSAIDDLAKAFCGEFDHTDLDDLVHWTEARAQREAAHMVGLALGLRLRGVDLGVVSGGAR